MLKLSKTPLTEIRGKTARVLLVTVFAYFNIGLVTLLIFGVSPPSSYYDYGAVPFAVVILVFCINVLFLIVAVFSLKYFLPDRIFLRAYTGWPILLLTLAIVVYFNFGNFAIDRQDIKSNSNLVSVILTATAYTYLSAALLCEANKMRMYVAAGGLVFAVVMAFEREVILFLLFPAIFRLDRGMLGTLKIALLSVSGLVLVASYKLISNMFRLSAESSVNILENTNFWLVVQLSLMRDNLHKGSLELFYFMGDAPIYSRVSYIMPLQIDRLFTDGARTNGQLATEYYTQGATGVGFSAVLESWLNFGILGIIILPVFIAYIVVTPAKSKSAFLTLAVMIFCVKLQRSDFWPSVIGHLLGPLLVPFVWKVMQRLSQGQTRAV